MYGSIGDVEYSQETLGLGSRLALEDVRLCAGVHHFGRSQGMAVDTEERDEDVMAEHRPPCACPIGAGSA